MNDTPYTKRELDSHFTSIKDLFLEHQKDDHDNFGDIKEILKDLTVEVRKTNGRVKALENYRWFLMGGIAVISVLLIPIVIKLATTGL